MNLNYQRIDGHLHIKDEPGLNIYDLLNAMERIRTENNLEYYSILSIPAWDEDHVLQNPLGILQKFSYPENTYFFGGLDYYLYPDYPNDCQFEKQLDTLLKIGIDGFKLIETKPSVKRQLRNTPFTAPVYQKFFETLEERKVPVLWHVGDPQTFWNRDEAPSWAFTNGWFYGDSSYITRKDLYEEVETILNRYPDLSVALAHMFFLSDDLERAAEVLEKHPNVKLDITPGTEMYGNFLTRLDEWRDFFLKYQDRILFGTDNGWSTGQGMQVKIDQAKDVAENVTRFLCTDEAFQMGDYPTRGIKLPESAAKKILRDNYLAFVGGKPKAIYPEAVLEYFAEVEHLLEAGSLADKERQLSRIREFSAIISMAI